MLQEIIHRSIYIKYRFCLKFSEKENIDRRENYKIFERQFTLFFYSILIIKFFKSLSLGFVSNGKLSLLLLFLLESSIFDFYSGRLR